MAGPLTPHARRAFTIAEFAIVAAIALVMMLILAVGSRGFLMRTKVVKVREEQALIARALENYRADYKRYPPPETQLLSLVAPTTYVASLPEDPFTRGVVTRTYAYYTTPGGSMPWILVSPGPDGRLDFQPMTPPEEPSAPAPPLSADEERRLSLERLALAQARASRDTGIDAPAAIVGDGTNSTLGALAPFRRPPPPQTFRFFNPAPHPAGQNFADRAAFRRYLSSIAYDPTNGIRSAGDIFTLPEH